MGMRIGIEKSKDTKEKTKHFKNKKVIVIFCFISFSFALFTMIFYHTKSNSEDNTKDFNEKNDRVASNVVNSSYCPNEIISFIGDGYCDDNANIEVCFYDKGDCCRFENPNTFSMCSSCQCKINISEWLENQVGGYLPNRISI